MPNPNKPINYHKQLAMKGYKVGGLVNPARPEKKMVIAEPITPMNPRPKQGMRPAPVKKKA